MLFSLKEAIWSAYDCIINTCYVNILCVNAMLSKKCDKQQHIIPYRNNYFDSIIMCLKALLYTKFCDRF